MSLSSETALTHSMGQNGFKYLSTAGTATYATKKMCMIEALADLTLTTVSVRGDSLTAVAIKQGTKIVGEFSSVTCAGSGGALLAYLAER